MKTRLNPSEPTEQIWTKVPASVKQWLREQPEGDISATLRRLIRDEQIRAKTGRDPLLRLRRAMEQGTLERLVEAVDALRQMIE